MQKKPSQWIVFSVEIFNNNVSVSQMTELLVSQMTELLPWGAFLPGY